VKIVVTNKKARFQYHLLDSYEAGMELMGTEVKSLRLGGASLVDAYCKIENGELFLIDCNISQYSHGNFWNHDPRRKRRLLMHRKEILKLDQKTKEKGLTIIPTKIYFNDSGRAKVEISLARGKRLFDKREDIARRDVERKLRQRVDI